MSVLVKICGITSLEDALKAVEYGADFLGFNFYKKSPRYFEPLEAKFIFEEIPPAIKKTGIFVNEPKATVIDLAIDLGLDCLQFHGDETADYCNDFIQPWFKAFRLQKPEDVAGMAAFNSEFHLVDAHVEKAFGGTGIVADWDLAKAAKQHGKLILSGGLKPENIDMALRVCEPAMVDVASGVESSPGVKDFAKMEEFISIVKTHSSCHF